MCTYCSNRNPHFKANHAELDKIREMNPDQLRQYVDTWEWRHQYTPAYYERISEGSKRSAKIVWQVLDSLGIKHDTVIDVGCGIGSWKPEGCRKYDGIDYGIPKKVQPEIYFDWNLEEINFEIEIRTSCKYDLALCLEVAEHISESKSADLIAYLCSRADTVLFSAAIPGQGGTGHINEQWQSWWAELFAKNGFCPHLIDIRSKIWNNERVEAWYKQNMVIYQKEQKNWDITGYDYNINLVHPEMFTSCIQYWKNMSEKVNPINYDLR